MISGIVKASPEELKNKAKLAQRKIAEYRKALAEMERLFNGSSAFWEGRGGESFRVSFRKNAQNVKEDLAEFEAYPKDLLRLGGVYTEKTTTVEQIVNDINEFVMK